MKKSLFTIFIFLMFFSVFNSVAELKKSKPNPPSAVARGFSNLMFGWLEVPRGIVYENSRIPVVGLVVGPIKGALLTTWRLLAGTVDVVGMGLTREGLYSDGFLPEFVWDAPWISPCGEDVVRVDTLETSSCLNEEIITDKKCYEEIVAEEKCYEEIVAEEKCNEEKCNEERYYEGKCYEEIVAEEKNYEGKCYKEICNEEIVAEEKPDEKYKIVKVQKIKKELKPKSIKKQKCLEKQATLKNDKEKYKTTVLCWKSPTKKPKKRIRKKRRSVENKSDTPVPFNLGSDDEFLEALDQIKHHVKNIEHQAQIISNR